MGAERGYDAADFVEELRTLKIRPHVAQSVSRRRSAIDRRTARHAGYAASLRARKRTEEAFGWIKTVAGLRRTKLRGLERVDWAFTFAAAAYKLTRLPKLLGPAHACDARDIRGCRSRHLVIPDDGGSIHITTREPHGDPVELNEAEAAELVALLQSLIAKLG